MHTIQCFFSGKKEPREYKTISEGLSDQGVLIVEKSGNDFELTEGCDQYFSVLLTPEQLRALGKELIALSESHQDTEGTK